MKVPMGPPPPLNKNPIDDYSNPTTTSSTSVDEIQKTPTESNPGAASAPMKVPMGPPPPKYSNEVSTNQNTAIQVEQQQQQLEKQEEPQLNKKPVPEESNRKATPHDSITIPYTIPPWNHTPPHPYSLEVLKEGLIIDNYNVTEKGAYMFGRVDLCDFVLEHPTISRFHAVLQFKQGGEAYIYDLGSTHGTFVNKTQVKKKVYTELHVGDVIRFGNSSRLYIFQGPSDLMPAESDLRKIRRAKIHEGIQDREASLLRAKKEASLADGISWGMGEDAIEEVEEDTDEVTWQTYKGQLTERQEKTRDKIIKRTEKITNMKKEIDAIRVKDIAQGGLTQGQQTQIARNEQRMSQILEELESLEETLNESIQESIGARTGKFRGKKKVVIEEDDEISDDDEFYDRTKKPAIQKGSEHQSVETADSLLDKKEVIMKEIEDKKNLLLQEETRILPETDCGADGDDALDAYMTGLSSQMKHETAMQLQKGLSTLQSELDKILYLLKIADPSGEASKKRNAKLQTPKANQLDISSGPKKCPPTEIKKSIVSERSTDGSSREESPPEATAPVIKLPEVGKDVKVAVKSEVPVYVPTKPQWLGDVHDIETKENQREAPLDAQEPDDFVDYKDRKAALVSEKNVEPSVESGIEGAAPGLIIRKRKQIERPEGNEDNVSEQSTSESAEAEATAADAVALLLKHERGYLMPDREEQNESLPSGVQTKKKKAKSKRVLGPERPVFLDGTPEYESWVPPKGQSGDGRTSLNERYGY